MSERVSAVFTETDEAATVPATEATPVTFETNEATPESQQGESYAEKQTFLSTSEMLKAKLREMSTVATEVVDRSERAGLSEDTTLEELAAEKDEQHEVVVNNREVLSTSEKLKERLHNLKEQAVERTKLAYAKTLDVVTAPKAVWLDVMRDRAEQSRNDRQRRAESANFAVTRRAHEIERNRAQRSLDERQARIESHEEKRQKRLDRAESGVDNLEAQREKYIQELVDKKSRALARKEMRRSLRTEGLDRTQRDRIMENLRSSQLDELGRASLQHKVAEQRGEGVDEAQDRKQKRLAEVYDSIETGFPEPGPIDAVALAEALGIEPVEPEDRSVARPTKAIEKHTQVYQEHMRRSKQAAEQQRQREQRDDRLFMDSFGEQGLDMIAEGRSFGYWVDRNREEFDNLSAEQQGKLEDTWTEARDRMA